MKRNNETGLYEAYKLIAATNHALIGSGATKEQARQDLKEKIKQYRAAVPVVMVGSFNSPGYLSFETKQGIDYKKVQERRGYIWVRNDPEFIEARRKVHAEKNAKVQTE